MWAKVVWFGAGGIPEPWGRVAHRHGSGISVELSPNEIPPLDMVMLDRLKRQLLLSYLMLDKTHIWVEEPVSSVVAELVEIKVEPRRLRRSLVMMKMQKV